MWFMKKRWGGIPTKEKWWLSLWESLALPLSLLVTSKVDRELIYPNIHIVLSFLIWCINNIHEHSNNEMFWLRENVGYFCGLLLVVSLSWVVVIDHIIFLMKKVYFIIFWLNSNIDDLILLTTLLFLHILRRLLGYFLPLQSKTGLIVGYINHAKFHFFLKKLIYSPTLSFANQICCFFIICYRFNFFIDQNSQ